MNPNSATVPVPVVSTRNAKPECYGAMYPDLAARKTDVRQKGKVFETLVESSGLGITARRFWTNTAQWDHCTNCSHYRFCYDLSLAKLLLGGVLEHNGATSAA
jgi:hypothetical protein